MAAVIWNDTPLDTLLGVRPNVNRFGDAMRQGMMKSLYRNLYMFKEVIVSGETAFRIHKVMQAHQQIRNALYSNTGTFTPMCFSTGHMINIIAYVLGFSTHRSFDPTIANWTPASGMGFFTKLDELIKKRIGTVPQWEILGNFPYEASFTPGTIHIQLEFLKEILDEMAKEYDPDGQFEKEMKQTIPFLKRARFRSPIPNSKRLAKNHILKDSINKRILEIESRGLSASAPNFSVWNRDEADAVAMHYRNRGYTVVVTENLNRHINLQIKDYFNF